MRGILTYHSIDRSNTPISVTPEAFQAHVTWLASGVVRVVSLTTLLALPDDVDAVALTFDDALGTVMSEAFPAMAAHGLTATVFVVTGHVGGDNRWSGRGDQGIPTQRVLDWHELGTLQDAGFTIGSHTRHHPRLTNCSPGQLADELAGARDDLRAGLGTAPETFAYPYGDVDAAIATASAQTYRISCTTRHALLDPSDTSSLVPRLDAWYFRTTEALARWGSPGFGRRVALRRSLRRVRRLLT